MRILFVNEKLGWFGGVEQNIADTVVGLRARRHTCYLAWVEKTNRRPDDYADLFDGNIQSTCFGGNEGKTLASIEEEFKPDYIYFHKIKELPSRDGMNQIPWIRMVHDHDLCCPRRHKYYIYNTHVCNKPAGWRCWLDLAWLQKAPESPLRVRFQSLAPHRHEMKQNHSLDLCLVGSRFMKSELTMNGFADNRVQILPPVVRREKQEIAPVSSEPHILFVGQLIRGKGVDMLLHALSKVTQPFHATIAGEGNARPELEALCGELNLQDKVKFAGWVDNKDLDAYYRSARVLAVPVRWPEPFGMIGLEAMHQSRPIVAFGTGGVVDWLRDGVNGLLVEERDVLGFARALDRLLSEKELAEELGQNGWKLVHSEYSFEKYLDRLTGYLQEVAS